MANAIKFSYHNAESMWNFAALYAAATSSKERRDVIAQFKVGDRYQEITDEEKTTSHPQYLWLSRMSDYISEVGSVANIPQKDKEYLERQAASVRAACAAD
jgi:hypothetical protein